MNVEDKNSRLAVNGGLRGKLAEAQALIGQRQLEPALDLLRRAREAALAEQDVESLRDVLRLAERVQFRAKGRGVREQASDLVAAVAADLAPKARPADFPPERRKKAAHTQKFSAAWWLKAVGTAPMLGTGLIFLLFAATANRVAQGAIAFLVIASVATAFGYLAWRRPRLTGGLLVAFAPIGFGLGALGGLGAAIWFAGVPLVSGLLLIVASLWRKRPTFTSSL